MCGKTPKPAPKADPEADRLAAAAEATKAANAQLVEQRRRQRTGANLMLGTAQDADTLSGAQAPGAFGYGSGGGLSGGAAVSPSAMARSAAAASTNSSGARTGSNYKLNPLRP